MEFNCSEVAMDDICENILKHSITKHYLLPPCCINIAVDMIKCLLHILDKHHIEYYIIHGTLLGSVKFSDYIPWDTDIDFRYRNSDMLKIRQVLPELNKAGCPLIEGGCGSEEGCYAMLSHRERNIWSGISVEFQPISTEGWESYIVQSVKTKVMFHNMWVTTFDNPGFIVRNRYGLSYLKHSINWRFAGHDHFGKYNPGRFQMVILNLN